MKTQATIKRAGDFIRNSATLKIFSIGLFVMILLVPASMVSSLMRERKLRRDSVVQEINHKWGNSQTITCPFFTVPYKSFYRDKNDKLKFNIHYLHVLPEKLTVSGQINPEIRYRSIYEAVLYNVKLNINGNFILPELNQSNIDPENVLWDKAIFSIGITDMRGIQDNICVLFNGKKYDVSPGLKTTDLASAGLHCVIPLSSAKGENLFSFRLNLNGSENIQFIPIGKTTDVSLKSSWASPSFNGSFLPVTRKISSAGFTAEWNILHLNRNFPQFWLDNQYKITDSSFGLKLLITTNIYQKSIRISKYALIFIIFTFAAFFFSEIISKKRVHPIQYILIGLAILLFYILLLSISEHLNFDIAYILSALVTTILITGYSKGILKNNRFTLAVFGILIVLYSYLYVVLQLEDYALIMGSIGLLFVLSTVMYITRKIDWYSLEKKGE
ncbi:MAG: cell envelope integrity protein CreD [Chlamydiae bacterium]|nr:MAG: cell envelope integrity protein CreD [Chlamydiota bacterium]